MILKNENILHIELYLEKQAINFTKSGTKKKKSTFYNAKNWYQDKQ